jgi:phage terminase small subunit
MNSSRAIERGGRPPIHGLYTYLALNTDKWSTEMQEVYFARYTQLMNLHHVDQELDSGLVSQVCRYEVLLDQVWRYLAENGLFDAHGDYRDVLNMLGSYENALTRMYDKLGLTPESRKRLGLAKRKTGLAEMLSGREVGNRNEGGGNDDKNR